MNPILSFDSLTSLLTNTALLAQADAQPPQMPPMPTVSPVVFIVCGIFVIIMIAAMWKVFAKAGQPGWASIVPIYNYVVWCKIVGRPAWWVVLFFVCAPVVVIILSIDLAKCFGKGVGFALGMVFLPFIFWPMLGFGSATYQGPSVAATA